MIQSWLVFLLGMALAGANQQVLGGLFIGVSFWIRSMLNIPPTPSPMVLIQKMPIWKWFSVIYLLGLVYLTIIKHEELLGMNVLFLLILYFFPFIIPYIINEYRIYQGLKNKH